MSFYFKSFFFKAMQENQGVDLTWKALNWAFTLACMTNLLCCRQHFKICSMQWEPNETWCHQKNTHPINCDWSDEGLILPCILSDSVLWSVVTGQVNIDRDWLPVDHWINHIHQYNERIRGHVCVEKSWRQQLCMCYGGIKPQQILQVCIRAISLQRREIQLWLLLICHPSNPNNSFLQGNEWVVRRLNDKHKESDVKFNQKNWNLWVKILDIDYFCCCPGTENEVWGGGGRHSVSPEFKKKDVRREDRKIKRN